MGRQRHIGEEGGTRRCPSGTVIPAVENIAVVSRHRQRSQAATVLDLQVLNVGAARRVKAHGNGAILVSRFKFDIARGHGEARFRLRGVRQRNVARHHFPASELHARVRRISLQRNGLAHSGLAIGKLMVVAIVGLAARDFHGIRIAEAIGIAADFRRAIIHLRIGQQLGVGAYLDGLTRVVLGVVVQGYARSNLAGFRIEQVIAHRNRARLRPLGTGHKLNLYRVVIFARVLACRRSLQALEQRECPRDLVGIAIDIGERAFDRERPGHRQLVNQLGIPFNCGADSASIRRAIHHFGRQIVAEAVKRHKRNVGKLGREAVVSRIGLGHHAEADAHGAVIRVAFHRACPHAIDGRAANLREAQQLVIGGRPKRERDGSRVCGTRLRRITNRVPLGIRPDERSDRSVQAFPIRIGGGDCLRCRREGNPVHKPVDAEVNRVDAGRIRGGNGYVFAGRGNGQVIAGNRRPLGKRRLVPTGKFPTSNSRRAYCSGRALEGNPRCSQRLTRVGGCARDIRQRRCGLGESSGDLQRRGRAVACRHLDLAGCGAEFRRNLGRAKRRQNGAHITANVISTRLRKVHAVLFGNRRRDRHGVDRGLGAVVIRCHRARVHIYAIGIARR